MLGTYKARAVPINVNYRYVADEARYILDNSDAVAVVFERAFAPRGERDPRRPSEAPPLRRARRTGSDAATRTPCRTRTALAAASPARDFEPRSADDLYLLYTGGTTGIPKGVMWRSEDIFFAALGGGGFGQPPITKPEELADRIPAEDARAIPMVNAPMMHGGGQWMAFINFFGGGTVVLNCDRHFDPDRIWRTVERERCNSVMVVGDAMGRPLAEALAAPGATYDASSVIIVGSGGAILSPPVKEQLRAQLPNAMVMDSFGASETGAAGSVFDTAGPGGRSALHDGRVHDRARRRAAPGRARIGRRRPPRPPRAHPARLLQGRREDRGHVRDRRRRRALGRPRRLRASSRPTAPSRCSAEARCASTVAARRCTPRRSRRCSSRIRTCSTPSSWASPTTGTSSASLPSSRRARAQSRRSRSSRITPRQARRLQAAAPAPAGRDDPAHTGREARLPRRQEARDKRARRRSSKECSVMAELGFWSIAREDPEKLALVDPDEREVRRGRAARVEQPGRARPARARASSRATRSRSCCRTARR